MAKRKPRGPKRHTFRNKLLLNQWMISLFGIDPFSEYEQKEKKVRPFHRLTEPIKSEGLEGLEVKSH